MITVHKFTVDPTDNVVRYPAKSRVVHVGEQHGEITLWVLLETEDTDVDHMIRVYGTGWEIEKEIGLVYHGTAHVGEFIWHVFESPNWHED